MQPAMQRPTDPGHIAYAGSPDEMWWSDDQQAWVPAVKKAPSLERVIQAYGAIREAREARKRMWATEDAALEEDQTKLRALMLSIMNDAGAQSIKTDHGTAYRTEKTKASAADWGAVYDWIMQDPERFEILEKRIKPTFINEYMEANDGAIPPGINVHREYEVAVRRPSNTSK